jgi:hypothetical protein
MPSTSSPQVVPPSVSECYRLALRFKAVTQASRCPQQREGIASAAAGFGNGPYEERPAHAGLSSYSGGGIRTRDLRVMRSPDGGRPSPEAAC